MQTTTKDERAARVQLYYQDQDFLAWITTHNFQHVNADTVSRYFFLYQQFKMCEKKECAFCSGSRAVWDSEGDIVKGRIRHERCKARTDTVTEGKAKAALKVEIPPAFHDLTWDNLPEMEGDAVEGIKNYIQLFPDNKPLGLYVYSKRHGAGRTSLLWMIIKELLRRRKITNFILHTTAMFIDKLQVDQFENGHPFSEKTRTCGLLLLDDFGRGKETGTWSPKIDGLLEERTWLKKPIILSSVIPLENWAWKTPAEGSLFSKIRRNMLCVCIKRK